MRYEIMSVTDLMVSQIPSATYILPQNRKDELWKDTCFEAFISQPHQESYVELNANSRGEWNVYQFESYRTPHPPREYLLTKVSRIECGPSFFEVEIDWPQMPSKLELSLCAVIQTADGPHYYSTCHRGAKPDFHLRESFTLRSER